MKFLLIILLLCSLPLQGQRKYLIKDVSATHPMYDYLSYQIDSVNSSIEQAVNWKFLPLSSLPAHADKNTWYWMKLELVNETNFDHFVVTVDQWSSVIAYIKEGTEWKQLVSGTTVPVRQRPLSLHRLLSFPVTIAPKETKTIYFKVIYSKPTLQYFVGLYSFLSKVELDENSFAFTKYHDVQLLVVFTLGVLTILFFYHLILSIINREFNSLLLSVYLFVSALAIANTNGIATNYLFSNSMAYELQLGMLVGHLIPILMILFLVSFLKLKFDSWEFYLLVTFILLVIVSFFVSFYSHIQWLYICRRYLVYVAIVVVLVASILKKKPGSKTLLLALVFTISTSFFAEFRSVFFKNIGYTGADMPYIFGVLVQMLILSFALTYRVRSLQQGVEAIKEEKRLLMEKQNDWLKIQVDEKTQQLKNALESLQQKKDELEEVNAELSQQAVSINELNQRLEQMVIRRTEALEATMHDLDIFLYRSSHDLRRPLMTILGISNLVMKERDSEKIYDLMGRIHQTVADMDRMLKKLIAISVCYNEQIDKEQVDLILLIQELMRATSNEYELHENQIRLTSAGQCLIFTNGYLMKTILTCIVENAVQYSEKGKAEIRISVEHQFGSLSVKIKDNGAGIDEAYHKNIFNMFFRGHEKSKGNGLGLYFVKNATEKLGGKVKLFSEKGKGTEVTLELPSA